MRSEPATYTGRFAPSPTGPLHFGSLLAAVASYIDARHNDGTWLVRMENLDPPREPPGTDQVILKQLIAHGLHWDEEILYQGNRLHAYDECIETLRTSRNCFWCNCSRPRLKSLNGIYDGYCRTKTEKPEGEHALRVQTDDRNIEIADIVQGPYSTYLQSETGDFVILRKDGLHAYQLAVVVDDAWQNITHVVRGMDLLDSTPRQVYLQNLLGFSTPRYAHIPVLVDQQGNKLSKQHFSDPVPEGKEEHTLFTCLELLGQTPPRDLLTAPIKQILEWASERWDIQAVPRVATLPEPVGSSKT